jgi:hypothetical protein
MMKTKTKRKLGPLFINSHSRRSHYYYDHVLLFVLYSIFSLISFFAVLFAIFRSASRFLPSDFISIAVHLCEVSVLIPIYNKARYLKLSFPSIFNLPINAARVCVLCYDDGSTDNSVQLVRQYQRKHERILLIEGKVNRGTFYARIRLIEATKTPWLVFLDPDDEFTGSGMVEALDLIKQTGSDIVQFGCHQVIREGRRGSLCWREPRKNWSVLDSRRLKRLWVKTALDVHLHRKIWRTELFQRGVRLIPQDMREKRIQRCEDKLLSGHVMLVLNGTYRYIPTIGEIRHFGWPDNSMTETYQSRNQSDENCQFAWNWTRRHFTDQGVPRQTYQL